MTLKELSNLQYLDSLIDVARNRILALEEKVTADTQVIDGMPKQPGSHDKVGTIVPEIVDQKAKLEALIGQYQEEMQRALEFIESVEDYHVRLILELRFRWCHTWAEVADKVGGGNTEESVKKTCYRFIEYE